MYIYYELLEVDVNIYKLFNNIILRGLLFMKNNI